MSGKVLFWKRRYPSQMRKSVSTLLSLWLAVSGVIAGNSVAYASERVRFEQCSELHASFPTGVAKSASAARAAVALGYERPAVRKKIFRKNRKALGPATAGSLCLTQGVVKEFAFQYNIDSSLPAAWVAEFETIMNNLGAVLPVPERIHSVPDVKMPFQIFAWNSAVPNPFPQIRGASGASISGNDQLGKHMILEIPEREFLDNSLHRYAVIAHEYFHIYHLGLSEEIMKPTWMIEGGAKVVEEIYTQQHYGQSEFDRGLFPVSATVLSNPEAFEQFERNGGLVGSPADINYNSSAFMVLALVDMLEARAIPEARAFEMVLKDFVAELPDHVDWRDAFQSIFAMSVEDFYSALGNRPYPSTGATDDWYQGPAIDISVVLPSKSLTLNEIFAAT